MNLKNSASRKNLFALGLLAWLVCSAGHAEIYKWVDANGQTHYSENKEEAGKAKVAVVRISSHPASGANPAAPDWKDQEQEYRQRNVQRQLEQTPQQTRTARPRPERDENQPETDAARCKLARDIMNGSLVHTNGAHTDGNDRMIAERDIRSYCH